MPPGPLSSFKPKNLDAQARKKAVKDPGPTWREYFFYQFLKVWLGLAFFIVDVLIVASFLNPFQPVFMAIGLLLAIYLEFLLYRYLWYRPEAKALSTREPFRPSWDRPVEYGRWTPEMDRIRRGLDPFEGEAGAPTGPDAREFL